MNRFFTILTLALIGLSPVDEVLAQNVYPAKPVRIVSPYAVGGSSDYMARVIAGKLANALKQSVIVENRPGAGGVIGTDHVAKSEPDGYTFLYGSIATHVIAPLLYEKIPYNALKDFTPVTIAATAPSVLVVHPSVPVRSLNDFILLAKAKANRITYGSAGAGSIAHLTTELFSRATSIKMVHVPYKGDAPALSELMGGQIDFMFGALPSAMTVIRGGRLRALAVSSIKRSPIIPNVPTVAESGVPDFEVQSWWMLFAPAKLPNDILKRVNALVVEDLKSPEVAKNFSTQGVQSLGQSPTESSAYLNAQWEMWSKAIKASGIKLQ